MRIAMVSEHASPLRPPGGTECGGQNLHVAELATALARRGEDVTVFTRRERPDQDDEVATPQGYRVVHVPAGPPEPVPRDELVPHLGRFAEELHTAWHRGRPDVVHSHFWMSGLMSLVAGAPLRVPVVHTYHALGSVKRRHQGPADTSPPERIRMERLIGRRAAAVVATCTDEVSELVNLGVARSRTTVVPCGVDCTLFTPAPAAEKRTGSRLRVMAVGRLVPRKGFAEVIAAVAAVPDAELVIAGGPPAAELDGDPEAGRLQALVEGLGVGDRVRLLGQVPRDRLAELLRRTDVMVSAPWYEPFGLVVLEAMASGTTTVATAVGGQLDTVVHGITGEHVPPRHPTALAATLRRLAADRTILARYGMAARNRAESRYTWDRVAAETMRVYHQVAPDRSAWSAELVGGRR